MKKNKSFDLSKELKPVSAAQSYEFLKKNKDKFISEFGKDKYEKAIAEYQTYLGNRKKSARRGDLESI